MYNPRFSIYHPKSKGNGVAVRMEAQPPTPTKCGGLVVELAPQKGKVNGGFDVWDWPHKMTVRLSPVEVAEVLSVLIGRQESIADGKGIFIRTIGKSAVFQFYHAISPVPCYCMNISVETEGEGRQTLAIVLTPIEGLALENGLRGSMSKMMFG